MKLYSALIVLSLIWGMSFLFIKVLLDVFDPWQIVFIRCVMGILTIIPLFLISRQKVNWSELPFKSLILVGFLNAGLPWGLIAWSETFLDSGYTAILNATTPIWTAMMGVLFFSIKLHGKQWIGVLVGFIGIVFLMDADTPGLTREQLVLGFVLMLTATCCYGYSSQFAKKNLQETTVWITALTTLFTGSVLSGLIMSFTGGWHLPDHALEGNVILSLVGLGMFGSGLAYLLYYYMISAGSAEFATLVTYLVPVSAVVWGSVLLNEKIPSIAYVGLFLIFFGVYLTGRKKRHTTIPFKENRTA
ncbi:DMT family transporter [Fictibacillus phosphorivorans]|uniref:DMT family transporter n=1 Tax=Fictibacillus phosphorivorans TaxID=1221500 RepID=UPI00203B3899|nr:DMT family transporter [Fictibacillus phosphorivorans]MCM3720329.1 DMT family transporter [Fictibacillus phosphorivorans]MCM3778019.1 DMT family transporter [Fictibacillus phosphorivorans]